MMEDSNSKGQITTDDMLKLVEDLVSFPFPQVCKHLAAGWIVYLLESKGLLSHEQAYALADKLCRADDEGSLDIIWDFRGSRNNEVPRRPEQEFKGNE